MKILTKHNPADMLTKIVPVIKLGALLGFTRFWVSSLILFPSSIVYVIR